MPATLVSDLDTSSSNSMSTRKRKRSLSPAHARIQPMKFTSLPPSILLLCLPSLFAHPPNHNFYIPSLILSLSALRKCVSLPALAPDIECRAWTAFAEIGMKVVEGGLSQMETHQWATGLEVEVEKAIGKGLLLAQKNPSLTIYHHALTLLHIRLAHWQQNTKFSRSLLKRLNASLLAPVQSLGPSSSPPWLIYTVHLTAIAHSLSLSPPDLPHVLKALQDLHKASAKLGDAPVTLLSHVIRLRTLVDAGMWETVGDSLELAESSLGISYDSLTPKPVTPGNKEQTFVSFEDPFEASMAVHVLIMGVVYFTHNGTAQEASPRLSHLHALLDSDALNGFPTGTIDIRLISGPPLTIKCTHPRVLYHLAFLVSSVSKRDAVGRKPKRKVFATEGLAIWEKESKKEILLPALATIQDVDEVDERMVKIKADLLSELVAISIMRSEFDDAENHLAVLTAHTRTYLLFPAYAARITLHHAHLAHALGQVPRALECYQAAAHLAEEGTFINAAARSGELAIRVGHRDMRRVDASQLVKGSVSTCQGMGRTLEAIAHVLQACASPEILTAKSHLKSALDIASHSQDNHLRALVLALIAALYIRTSGEHARKMLETCGQLAAGLGAPSKRRDVDGQPRNDEELPVGNAWLGLWVGERFLELYLRNGQLQKAQKQEAVNLQLTKAVEQLSQRH